MKPVFLIGAERSGSTVFSLMLAGHPAISWLGEIEYAVDYVTDENSWPDVEQYRDQLQSNRQYQGHNLSLDKTLSYPDLVNSFLQQKQKRDGKKLVGASCHKRFETLLRLFPQAKFIYLFRDPRDVARSTIGMGWAGNVWTGVDRWKSAVLLWQKLKKQLDKQSYTELKYEDLITDPEKTLIKICAFLLVPYDKKMLSYPEYTTYSFPDPQLTEQWKKKLADKEIELIESKVAMLMEDAGGYKVYSKEIHHPSFAKKLFLQLQHKTYCIHFRIKRYGLMLVLAGFMARRLRLKSLDKKIRKATMECDISHLK